MALRIEPNLADTDVLLGQILVPVMQDERVSFLVPAGQANLVMARVRVMISRKRAKMKQRGRTLRHFRLNSTVHRETHNGERMDCIIVWREIKDSHMMAETLEDLLAHG